MSTLPCRDDRAVVFYVFESKPQITQAQPKALYDWILPILIAFDNILNYILNDLIGDQLAVLSDRISALEVKSQAPQPQSTAASASIPQQPLRPSKSIRCKRCSALGHDTKDCRSKDPIAIKKRVTNNQKARKRSLMQDHPLPGPPIPPSVHFRPDGSTTDSFGHPLYFDSRTSTYQAFTALAADAKELRRRKMQSTRDRRRRGATSTTA